MTNIRDDQYLLIAESLNDRRVVSKQKARVIDVLALASCIRAVATTPGEEDRRMTWTGPHLLACSVCTLRKERSYFKEEQQTQRSEVRVCRYCTWRIRREVDKTYRELRGLGPRPAPPEVVLPDHSAAIGAYLEERRACTAALDNGAASPDPDELDVGGYYGPSFANLCSGWYFQTNDECYAPERDEMLSWWDQDCDIVVEWFLRRYGMFTSAFDEAIKNQVTRLLHPTAKWARYHSYFVMTRVLEEEHLWRILARDLCKRGRKTHRCNACATVQAYADIHPERIKWSDGVVLPLCNDCWNALQRSLHPAVPQGETAADFAVHIDSVLGEKTCPVCNEGHSWRGHSYTYTEGFYSVPDRYREICFACIDEAINRNSGDRRIRPNRDGLLEISKLIDDPPARDASKVVFEQAKSLAIAARVVRVMKTMWTFDRLASRHGGSWFATLVKSGCLPEGARKEHFGTRVLAKDGHECLSMGEMHIDNGFHRHRIKHRKEVRYPDSTFICDWVIDVDGKEVFVEYFGLAGQEEYDEKMDAKRAVASRAGLHLVEFLPQDMHDLEAAFETKILSLF